MSTESPIYNPEDVIKKEARGIEDESDLGEVQEVGTEYILTKKGTIDGDKFYIPKNLVERFDGHIVWFKLTEEESHKYKEHKTHLI
ncbi:MAG TPA: hypothetical protein VJU85_07915 [Nitrososphaeraceae archaeon]|jgi:hypothetical protein|nr:hypothetical protein [Nitrososphaeraceae archaeon]